MPDHAPTNAQLAEAVRFLAADQSLLGSIENILAPKPEPESKSSIPDDFLPPGIRQPYKGESYWQEDIERRDSAWRSYLRAVREGRA